MNNACKILVLSDVDMSLNATLKSALNLAKIVGGEIDLFCVKKPTEIVEKESQLSAMRTINEKFIATDNQLKSLIKKLNTQKDIAIRHKIAFGNLKDEIGQRLKEIKPDIVVLGKRKSTIFSFFGDNIIDFVLKEYEGTIMVASMKNPLKASSELSLGLLNDNTDLNSNRFKEILISFATKPLKSFKIGGKKAIDNEVSKTKETVEFVFEKGDNALKNMDNYLSKNKVQLLFVNKEKNKISSLIDTLNCSLLLTD